MLFEFAFAGREPVEIDGVGVADVAARFGGSDRFELAADRFHFAVDAFEIELERRIAEPDERLAGGNVGALGDEHFVDQAAAQGEHLVTHRGLERAGCIDRKVGLQQNERGDAGRTPRRQLPRSG